MLSFLFPLEHSSHSMHAHCHTACHVYYPLCALPAFHNPSPTKSLSHSPVFLFSVCSCFVVQCGMAPKRRKFLLQSQHNFGILPSRCVVSSAIDSYHIVLEVNQDQRAIVIACVDLAGLLGSIQQLTVWFFYLMTHGFWDQHCPLIQMLNLKIARRKSKSMITQLKQTLFWGAPRTGQSSCFSLSQDLREQTLLAS